MVVTASLPQGAEARKGYTCRYPRQPEKEKKNMQDLKFLANKFAERVMMTQKEVLTSDEAARYMGVSKSCLYKWTMNREIPHYKSPTGRMCYFNRREIEEWMQSVRVATDDELEQQAQATARKGRV